MEVQIGKEIFFQLNDTTNQLMCPEGHKVDYLCTNPKCKNALICVSDDCKFCQNDTHDDCQTIKLKGLTKMLDKYVSNCKEHMTEIIKMEEKLL